MSNPLDQLDQILANQTPTLDVKPSYDACITTGDCSFMLEFASLCSNEVYMQLLKLEHELVNPDNLEVDEEPSNLTRMNSLNLENQPGISRGYNYFFMIPGVYNFSEVIWKVKAYLESKGMKVKVRDDFPPIKEMELEHFLPNNPPTFVIEK